MVRRLLAVLSLAVIPFIIIPTALAPGAGAAPPGPVQVCLNGGWHTLNDASGQGFKNQGQCIAYELQHPVSLADLAGPFAGGTFSGSGGCSFVGETFNALYSGSFAVGTVTLQMNGCFTLISVTQFDYSGTFTFTTNVGTLSGTVAGQVFNQVISEFPPVIEQSSASMELAATSGTGLFTGTTGTLNVSLEFSVTTFTGLVTVA